MKLFRRFKALLRYPIPELRASGIVLGVAMVAFCFCPQAQAGSVTWTGTNSSTWGTGSNWTSGTAAKSADIAVFATTFSNQPVLTSNTTAAGLWLAAGLGQSVTINSSTSTVRTLTLSGNQSINGNTSTAILLDAGAGSYGLTTGTSVNLTVTNNTSFLVNNSGTLTVGGTLSISNGRTLTLGGTNAAGNIVISGNMAATSGMVNVNTAGTVTLGGSNALLGGLTLTSGTLKAINSAANFGDSINGNGLTLNGGSLWLADSIGQNYNIATYVSGTAQIISDVATFGTGLTYTFGALTIGGSTLTISGGSNVTSGTAGVVFSGTASLSGDTTFKILNPTGATTLLTVGGISNSNNNVTFDGNGNFAQTGGWGNGSGGLTTAATYSGTVILNQTNTFTGAVTINGGTVLATGTAGFTNTLGNNNSLYTVTLNGGTLVLSSTSGANQSFNRNFTIGGTSQIVSDIMVGSGSTGNTYGLGTLSIGSGTLTVAGGLNVTSGIAGVTFGATILTGAPTFNIQNPTGGGTTRLTLGATTNGTNNITLDGNGTFTQGGVLGNGTGGVVLAPTFLGTATLNQNNTFTGGVTVGGGLLNVSGSSASSGIAIASGTVVLSSVSGLGSPSATVTFSGTGGRLQIGLASVVTIGALNGTSGASIIENGGNSAATLTVADSGTDSYAGILQNRVGGGSLALIKSGSGTLTLTGANTFTGGLTLVGGILNATTASLGGSVITFNGGTLQSGSGGITTAKNVAMTGNGTFDAGAVATSSTLSGVISGGGVLTKTGAGKLTLSGTNASFSSGLVINNGTMAAGSSLAFGMGNITFGTSNTPTLDLNGQVSGTSGLLFGSGSNGIVTNTAGSGTATLSLYTSGTQSFAGVIQNGVTAQVGLTKADNGTQILNGYVTNSYSGNTTLNGGTLKLDFSNMSTPTNLVSGSSTLVLGGGVLSIQGKNSTATSQTFASLNASAGPGSIVLTPGTSGTVTLMISSPTVSRTAGATVNFNTSAGTSTTAIVLWNPTLTGGIIGGAYTITDGTSIGSTGFATVSGSNVVRYTALAPLTTANSTTTTSGSNFTTTPTDAGYTSGTLTLISGTHATNTLTITTGSGGGLNLGGQIMTFNTGALLMTGTGNYTITSGTLGLSGAELLVHQFGSGILTVSSLLGGGASSLTKDGSGILALTGSNSYTGGTTIDGGTIQISGSSNLGNGGMVVLNNNCTLEVTSGSFTLGQAITANGSGGVLQLDSGTGTLTQSLAVSITSDLTVKGAGNLLLSGTVSGAGGLTFDAAYSGTTTLSASNTFIGGLTINGGSVVATTSASALGQSTAVNAVTLNGGTLTLRNASGTNLNFGENVTVGGTSRIVSDVTASGAGNTYTFGSLWIGSQPLTIAEGSNVNGGTAGVTFGTTVLTGNATFNFIQPIGGITLLTLGAINDNGYTLTLTGTGNFAQSAAWGVGGTNGGLILGAGYSGTATLNQLNAYAGATAVNSGFLSLGAVNTLPGTTALTITGGTMSLGTFNNAITSLSLQGGAIIGTTGILTVASTIDARNGTISAVISGTAGLNKTTSGTVALSGVNNGFTGPITVSAGILRAITTATTNAFPLGSAAGGATLTLTGGTLQLMDDSSANFGQDTTVTGSNAQVQITMDRNTGAGAGVTGTLGALNIGAQTLAIVGGTSITSGTAGITFSGTTTLSGNTKITITNPAAAGTRTLLTLGSSNINNYINDNGYTLTLAGNGNFAEATPYQNGVAWGPGLGGGLTLDASYTGTATLNQNNLYSGPTIINGGTLLAYGNGNALGQCTGTNALTLGGGTLILGTTVVSATTSYAFYLNTLVTGSAQIIANLTGTTGQNAMFTLAGLIIGNQTLTIAGGANVTSGTASITFDSVFSPATLVGSPTFKIVNPTSGTAFTLLNLGLIVGGTNNITLDGNGIFAQRDVWSGAGGLILAPTFSGTATLSQNNTFTGGVKVGGGQLILNGPSYSSGIAITGGTATLGNILGLGQTAATVTFSGTNASKLVLNSGTSTFAITISALSGTSTAAVVASSASAVVGTDTLIIADYPQVVNTYAGALQNGNGNHPLALTKAGSGTLILTGTNTYTGLLTLSGGVLNATTASINGGNTTNGITFNGGTLQAGTGGIITGKAVTMTGAGTFDTGSAATSSTLSGVITGTSVGTGALTVSGSGFLMLTNASNNFTGGLILTGGTLNGTTNSLKAGSNAITFNGGTLQAGAGGITVSTAVTLAGNGTFDTNGNNSTISGILAGSGLFTKTGAGALTLSGVNTFDGGVVIAGGTLVTGTNTTGVAGQGNVTLTGSGTVLDLRGASPTIGLLASTVTSSTVTNSSSTPSTLTLFGSGTQTFSGIITDGANQIALIKTGVGVEIFSGTTANTYSGATTINGGTLKLNFSNMGTPTNLISPGNLNLGGGILSIQGKASTSSTQSVSLLTASAGPGSIVLTPGTSGTVTLSITGFNVPRSAGATVNFNTSAGTPATARVLWVASPINGIIGGAYTITDNGGTGFAALISGSVVRSSTGTALTTVNSTGATTTTNFTTAPNIDGGYTSGTLTLTSGTHATNTLAIASGSGGTLNLSGQSLTFNTGLSATAGALLMTGTGNYLITNGMLGASGAELIIHQFGTGVLTVSGTLGGGAASLTMDGTSTGVLALTSTNNFNSTGVTTLNGGILQISGSGNLSSGPIILNGGTLDVTNGFTLGRTITAAGSGGTLQVDSGTLTEASAVSTGTSNLTISGLGNTTITAAIGGVGVLIMAGNGSTLTLTNATANTSGLAITSGTVVLGAAQTITNHYGLSMSGTSTLDLAGYALWLNNTSANSVTFGPGTLLMNSGVARAATFNGPNAFVLNFNGGQLGGQEISVGTTTAAETLNITAGLGGGSLYLGQSTNTPTTTGVNLSGTGVLNLGSIIEMRMVFGVSSLFNALNVTVANTVTGFYGGSIVSSEYAILNPVGINNIYTTANNSLVFAAGGAGFTLSGGTIDVRTLSVSAAAGGIVTNGNGLTISGGNLLGNSLAGSTGSIALQSGNLLLANTGLVGISNFTISNVAGNDGRTIQMVSGNTGTFTAATATNPGKIIIGTLIDGGTWDRGTLNSGSNYTITSDIYGTPVFGSSLASYTIANNSGFAGLVTGTSALFGSIVNGTNAVINTGTLTLGVNSTFFALSGTAPSLTYNVGVAGGSNTIITSATGGFVFGINDSYTYSTSTINLNRDKGNSNVTLLSNGVSTSNDININANQTGSGNLLIAAQNLTLNAGFTFGGTGGILTDPNPANGQINYVLNNGAGNFNGAGPVNTFLTINGAITGTNTISLNAESVSTLNSGIALGANAAVGGVQTWSVHQIVLGGTAFANAMTTSSNWASGSVSFSQTGNYGSFEAATNSSAPSTSSDYKFNSLSIASSGVSIGQYLLTNNTQNDGGISGTKEALYTGLLSLTLGDTNNSRYTFELNGQDLYVDRFSNVNSTSANGLIWMNSAAGTVSDIRALTGSDTLVTGGFHVLNGATLEVVGGDYNNLISSRSASIMPSDDASAPTSGITAVTGAYDASSGYSPSANISFLGSGNVSGTNVFNNGRGTNGTLRIIGGKMTSNAYILNPVNTVGLIDTTDGGVGPVADSLLNTVTIRASSSQALTAINTGSNTLTPTVKGVYSNGDVVRFATTGALPSGLALNTLYYVVNTDPTTGAFSVATTPGGTAVALGSAGSGTTSVQDWAGASDLTQYPALIVGGTTTVNGNLTLAYAPGAVNQSTLRVGAVSNSQGVLIFNQSAYTSATAGWLNAGSGYTTGTQGASVAFTTGLGTTGTVGGTVIVNASHQITSLTLNLSTATDFSLNPVTLDLQTVFGTITSNGITSGTAGAFSLATGSKVSPIVYVATQTNSSAALTVTGNLTVSSSNNLVIQNNGAVFVGGNVNIQGVGQNQVMLITGTGVGIDPTSNFTLNGNTGSATPQTVNSVPALGSFHVGDGSYGTLYGNAAQATLAANLTVNSNSDINGPTSSLSLSSGSTALTSNTLTLANNSTLTVGGTLNVGSAAKPGSVVVTGSLGGGGVYFNTGSTLAGNGSILSGSSGSLTINDGVTIVPGDTATGIGKLDLTASNISLSGSLNLSLAVTSGTATGTAGTNFAQLTTGTLDLTNVTAVTVSLQKVAGDGATFDPTRDHLWQSVISTTTLNAFNTSLFTINSTSFFPGDLQGGVFSVVQNVNALDLQYLASVPEPETWALLVGGVGLLSLAQRLRRRIQS